MSEDDDGVHAYRGFNVNVYRSVQDGRWCADWWYTGNDHFKGSEIHQRKKEAERLAHAAIDATFQALSDFNEARAAR